MREIKIFDTVVALEEPKAASRVHVLRTPSPLDGFQTEVVEDGKKKIMFITSDIAILFNQQRLMNLNPAVIQELTQNLKRQKPDMKLSDEQLFGALKSRYIQSNADIYAWSRAIQADLDGTISSIEAEASAREAAAQEAAAQEAAAQAAAAQVPAAGNASSE